MLMSPQYIKKFLNDVPWPHPKRPDPVCPDQARLYIYSFSSKSYSPSGIKTCHQRSPSPCLPNLQCKQNNYKIYIKYINYSSNVVIGLELVNAKLKSLNPDWWWTEGSAPPPTTVIRRCITLLTTQKHQGMSEDARLCYQWYHARASHKNKSCCHCLCSLPSSWCMSLRSLLTVTKL